MSYQFEKDLVRLLDNVSSSINSLVDISKQSTVSSKEINVLISGIETYATVLSAMQKNILDPNHSFPDADIPEYVVQSLEESVNLDIPSYNVSRDLNTQLELTESKISAFKHYHDLVNEGLSNKAKY